MRTLLCIAFPLCACRSWESQLEGGIEALRAACDRGGRDYESIDRAIFAAAPTEDSCRANVDRGFTDQMFALPSETAEKLMPMLDNLAELANKVR